VKRHLFPSALVVLVFVLLSACTKKDPEPGNRIAIGSEIYYPHTVSRNDSLRGLTASAVKDSSHVTVYLLFHTLPTASGTFKIINTTNPKPDEVCVTPFGSSLGSYTGNSNQGSVTITVSNSKISAFVPPIWVKNINNPQDSLQFSASLTE